MLTSLVNLKELELSYLKESDGKNILFTESVLKGIAKLPSLKKLELGGMQLNDVNGLLNLTHLEDLEIDFFYNSENERFPFNESSIKVIEQLNKMPRFWLRDASGIELDPKASFKLADLRNAGKLNLPFSGEEFSAFIDKCWMNK